MQAQSPICRKTLTAKTLFDSLGGIMAEPISLSEFFRTLAPFIYIFLSICLFFDFGINMLGERGELTLWRVFGYWMAAPVIFLLGLVMLTFVLLTTPISKLKSRQRTSSQSNASLWQPLSQTCGNLPLANVERGNGPRPESSAIVQGGEQT